jgi:hypothetical protein
VSDAQPNEEVQILRHENAVLRAQVAWFKKRFYGGDKSEKLDASQLNLSGVEAARAAVTERTEQITYERSKGAKRATPAETFAHVPVTETVEIVPLAVQQDPALYEKIGEERTFEIDVIPPKLVKRAIVRPKYRHRLDRSRPPLLAAAPARVVPGGYVGGIDRVDRHQQIPGSLAPLSAGADVGALGREPQPALDVRLGGSRGALAGADLLAHAPRPYLR